MTKDKKKTGPEPETLNINGNWEDAMKKAMGKKKPKDGWPDKKPKKTEK